MSVSTAAVTLEIAQSLGLTAEEFDRIHEIMGRAPNFTELSIFSVMWSEHCSYKNSITLLKTLPRKGDHLLVEAGEENAGLVDIGDGLACAFKIESHNHPSAIEPYQGAATGVGGIHRDIFTMGARPIAALNSLRFGNPKTAHMRRLIEGVVAGIGDYGNCFGVPTVGGEVYFDDCYNQNILVNAMSVGIVKVGDTVSASADGPGNPVFIVGSATGKDGIHGATFASAELTEDSADDLPAVQVGDPFQEKLLLEASLEAIQTGAIVGMQDMGAAGITCSTSEMSAKSGTGMLINLDEVPTRQANMEPFEILLSESQERMLIVCEKGREADLLAVFDKWDLECCLIGEVTDTGFIEFTSKGETVAKVPADDLVLGGGAPIYKRTSKRPAYMDQIEAFDPAAIDVPSNLAATARDLLNVPTIASKKWITTQYDSMVRTNTLGTNAPSDAAISRIKGTDRAIVSTADCNSSYVFADPYKGAMIAVSEAARNIVCSGGTPSAVTNCLNFGNPYNEEVYYQFENAIKGMGAACEALGTPVTGGNVSFYNQSEIDGETVPVFPTPTIGMVGLLNDLDKKMTLDFKNEGDVIYLLGEVTDNIDSSIYLRKLRGVAYSPAPYFEMDKELKLQADVLSLIDQGLLQSAHDVSEGGLFVSLFESCKPNDLGVQLDISSSVRDDAFWFGEGQSRVVVSVSADQVAAFEAAVSVPVLRLGEVQGSDFIVNGASWGSISDMDTQYETALPNAIGR